MFQAVQSPSTSHWPVTSNAWTGLPTLSVGQRTEGAEIAAAGQEKELVCPHNLYCSSRPSGGTRTDWEKLEKEKRELEKER